MVTAPRFTRRLLSSLALLPALLLSPGMSAQPDALVVQLLFDPVALPAQGELPVRPLIAFSDAETDIPAPAAERLPLPEEEIANIEIDIAAYLAQVGDREVEEGPYSDQLREDLFNTGLLYQKLEDHENALRMM